MYYYTSDTPVLNSNENCRSNRKELLSRYTKGKKSVCCSLIKKSLNFAAFPLTNSDLKHQCKDPCSKAISSL